MKIFKFKNFSLVCQYRDRSGAWGHEAVLLFNNHEQERQKTRYYNRTWERWTFETAGKNVIYKAIEQCEKRAKSNLKYFDKKKRVTKKDIEKYLENDNYYKGLFDFYKAFNACNGWLDK